MLSTLHSAVNESRDLWGKTFGNFNLNPLSFDELMKIGKETSSIMKARLQAAFPSIPIYGAEDEDSIPDSLPQGVWIGFDPLHRTRNFQGSAKYWDTNAFIIKDGIVKEAVAFDWKGVVGVITEIYSYVKPIPEMDKSKTVTYSIPIFRSNEAISAECLRYQKYLRRNFSITNANSCRCAMRSIISLLSGFDDAFVSPGSYNVLKLAAMQLIFEKAGGVVLDEFGEKVVCRESRQNVIFARNREAASKFFMPKDFKA